MRFRIVMGSLGVALGGVSALCLVFSAAAYTVRRPGAGPLGFVLGVQFCVYAFAALVCLVGLLPRGRAFVSRRLTRERGVAALCALGFCATLPITLATDTTGSGVAVATISVLLGVAPLAAALATERLNALASELASELASGTTTTPVE